MDHSLSKALHPIRKAIFPVAGLGTRFLPATKAHPKEMLPIVDKPLIQYAVEEAYQAGIKQMIFVTGRTKRSIEDHFDTAYELEMELELAGKSSLAAIIQNIKPPDMQCIYLRQQRALGLGHAILCSRELIDDEPFAILLADDLMMGKPPVMAQLVEQFHQYQSCILAVEEVPRQQTNLYGIVTGQACNEWLVEVSHLVEKPEPQYATSTLAIAGRYILTPGIFDEIMRHPPKLSGEIGLTEALASLLEHERILAYRYDGIRYDCGSKLGFLKATVDLGLKHEGVGEAFAEWLHHLREKSS